ncbi:TPA: hypothetical protein N3C02_004224 [Vibrio parahaemolyticus]|uniref:hypothetical protein n=1 Tax=Vibrio parahaemolyticus TaxID=670 RepID=UPI0004727B80|nr:hypothetical protein [Vibrio parahaemolyticus]EGQ7945946.1 hypothetical protein [Vibrio parahaemolyticus]EHH2464399.1 hypothetical protein [Vibrio parahaemolyticus]EHR6442189.1 hypothetical protein [Vibrio parahaemolyticus]MBM4941500.1 hypothetical protein [Vibrio parahaemolyticus]MCC3820270.1 hypothetical protein [Vibrio parahaemolyticus]
MKLFSTGILFLAISLLSTVALAEKTVTPLIDGMILNLKENQLQTLEIKLKNIGNGGVCVTTIEFADTLTTLIALPEFPDKWTQLEPAVMGGVRKISLKPQCDAEVIGEVRFYSD